MMEGTTVKVLRGEYVVPGVTLRLHFRHERALDALRPDSGIDAKEGNKLLIAFAVDILKQNYPGITEDDLLDRVAMTDIGAIIGAALPQSGYSRRPLEPKPSESPAPTSSDGSSTQPAGESTTSST